MVRYLKTTIGDKARTAWQRFVFAKLKRYGWRPIEDYRVRTLSEEAQIIQQQIREQLQQQYANVYADQQRIIEKLKWELHECKAKQSATSGIAGIRKDTKPRKSRRTPRN